MSSSETTQTVKVPRIAITYCTKCKWMLRAAYYAQELLSTFDVAIGEIALIPTTGGIFHVYVTHQPTSQTTPVTVLLWDYKVDGGFPETKVLKQRLRDQIQPERKLGHSDTPGRKAGANRTPSEPTSGEKAQEEALSQGQGEVKATTRNSNAAECTDCQ